MARRLARHYTQEDVLSKAIINEAARPTASHEQPEPQCEWYEPWPGARLEKCRNCGRELEWTLKHSRFWNDEPCSGSEGGE